MQRTQISSDGCFGTGWHGGKSTETCATLTIVRRTRDTSVVSPSLGVTTRDLQTTNDNESIVLTSFGCDCDAVNRRMYLPLLLLRIACLCFMIVLGALLRNGLCCRVRQWLPGSTQWVPGSTQLVVLIFMGMLTTAILGLQQQQQQQQQPRNRLTDSSSRLQTYLLLETLSTAFLLRRYSESENWIVVTLVARTCRRDADEKIKLEKLKMGGWNGRGMRVSAIRT